MPSTILTSFSGALQASLSVLLVIFYGVLASQFNLLSANASKEVSHLSVKLFLPFLLITKVGKQLSLENVSSYGIILVWSLFYTLLSILIGVLATRYSRLLLKRPLPPWVVPAIAFNNTTSLPLLLIQSFESTGILDIILQDGESMSQAIDRAQSYFLVCSVVSNCLTFALGPRLLEGHEDSEEDSGNDDEGQRKEDDDDDDDDDDEEHQLDGNANGDVHHGRGDANAKPNATHQQPNSDQPDETTSLLPDRLNHLESQTTATIHDHTHAILLKAQIHPTQLHPATRSKLSLLGALLNPPFIGALLGALIGLTPPLHKSFFAPTNNGGFFTAWLTASLKNAGGLFVSLQVIVVGVKLSSSLRKLKRGDDGASSGRTPWSAVIFVFAVRYVFWPAVSVPLIYALAHGTTVLGKTDGVLWFSMMLMPTGPPAMSLVPMADVSGKDEGLKMAVAKLLTGMYAFSPVLAIVVVASMKASQSALEG